jgi:short-subunit dehydrogenase
MSTPDSRPLAVVTGASSGIGRELAVQFARAGYDLVVAAEGDRIADAAASFEAEAPEGIPIQADAIQADLATYDGVETLWRAIELSGRTPGAVAINAGVGVGGDFARENKLSDELNLIAA